jgi:hypothetical protein
MQVSAVLGSLLTGELTMQPHRAADAAAEQQQGNSSGTSKRMHIRSAAPERDSFLMFHRPQPAAPAAGDANGGSGGSDVCGAVHNLTNSSKLEVSKDVSMANCNHDANRQADAAPADDEEAAEEARGRQQQQHQEQDKLVKFFAGPCLFPDYALHWPQQQQQQQQDQPQLQICQQQPSGRAAGLGASDGSRPSCQSSSRGRCQGSLECVHPVWLLTQGLCMAYRMEASVVRQLCDACPQLGLNLQLLLQPVG